MSFYDLSFFNTQLSKRTSIFGLRLWLIIAILLASFFLISLFLISLCLTSRRRKNRRHHKNNLTPVVSKEVQEIKYIPPKREIQVVDVVKLEIHRHVSTSGESRVTSGSVCETTSSIGSMGPEVSHLGWGRCYALRELEAATNGLCEESVIGKGGYGIVYKGVLSDGTRIAVKNLLNNKGQAEREFKVEVEIIGRVRHKNLVRLLGYCVEGAHRMLVYEYVDNGNLEEWLHGDVGPVSPMTWDIRMNLLLGTAKGLAYLHEGLEPKVVHRDVKSSNILIDRQWNAKVSDFGLAKLLDSDHSFVTTRVMGTFGYVAPEYAFSGMLNERSDVYSFGILIMEIISGRTPVDYSRPKGEVNLIEWLKDMVGSRRSEEVVDPKLSEKPSLKALKRALLIALRCVDPDSSKRPKMGHVIHMLEADDVLFREDRRNAGESSYSHSNYQRNYNGSSIDKSQTGGDTTDQSESEDDSSRSHHEPTRWRR